MAMRSEMSGNVLMNPVLKTVKVKGEDRQVCELRVMCSNTNPTDKAGTCRMMRGRFLFRRRFGTRERPSAFMKSCGSAPQSRLSGLLTCGPGSMSKLIKLETGMCMDAERVTLGLQRVESVLYRSKAQVDAQKAPDTAPAAV